MADQITKVVTQLKEQQRRMIEIQAESLVNVDRWALFQPRFNQREIKPFEVHQYIGCDIGCGAGVWNLHGQLSSQT